MTRLEIKLFAGNKIRQRLRAEVGEQKVLLWERKIIGIPKVINVSGISHINPEAIKTIDEAYKTFEAIRCDYERKGETTKIEIIYN
mgnify:CR=1 FL=1